MVDLLLKFGARAHEKTNLGDIPAQLAYAEYHIDVMYKLLAAATIAIKKQANNAEHVINSWINIFKHK